MSHSLEDELLNFVNTISTPEELVECFRDGDEQVVSLELAQRIFQKRNSLAGRKFSSIGELAGIHGINQALLVRIIKILPGLLGWLPNDHPVLLLPIRLETRFLDDALWVRIYPDQAFVDVHEPRLTQKERDSGKLYYDTINAIPGDAPDRDETKRSAWRRLAQLFGPERAAWIARTVEDNASNTDAIPIRSESLLIAPKLVGLPYRFVVYAYRPDGSVICKRGNPIRPGLTLLGTPSRRQRSLFDRNSKWVTDHETARDDGMAVRIPLSQQDRKNGFSRIVVVGMRMSSAKDGDDAEEGQSTLEKLIEAQHYSAGLGFLKYGTPTNNAQGTKAGHSEIKEDREGSYDIEVTGAPNWDDPRTNSSRLGRVLGLGSEPEVLHFLANAGDTSDSYAEEMQTALWPATGDYFLRYLLRGVVPQDGLNKLAEHFTRFVRAGGPLPAIRVGDQPYGILPVTSVRTQSDEHPIGWVPSTRDSKGDTSWSDFDEKLHAILVRLQERWLTWAMDPDRVPRITATSDPDKELLEVLSMEPLSVDYRMRPFVDEGLVDWLLLAMRGHVFGAGTPYELVNRNHLHWTKRWSNAFDQQSDLVARYWNQITDAPEDLLRKAPLLHLFGWSDRDLELGVAQYVKEETQEYTLAYLRQLCEGNDRGNAKTLLRELLQRALKLAPESSIALTDVRDAICRLAVPALLDFFNTVTSPEQIMRRVSDDPDVGKRPPRAYGVRRSLAQRILKVRDSLPDRKFTSVDQIDKIIGVGEDTLHDILHAFRDQKAQPDIDTLFRQALDLCSHRLDAWMTSLATKRLVLMREEAPSGIYLGAYGYVENLVPDEDTQHSEGFLHAPSVGQAKAAAVLHNAYLTHSYRIGEDGQDQPNPFRINLTSERVRQAMQVIEGMRQGQPVGALLGYQFEKRLSERHLAQYIDEFRAAFPIVGNKENEMDTGESVEALAARNVVDGLALTRWWEDPNRTDITPPDPAALDTIKELLKPETEEKDLSGDNLSLRQEVGHLRGSLDGVSDLMIYEGVYHAVQWNYERSGAALDVLSGNAFPQEIESMTTPVTGKSLGHRVCIIFPEPDGDPEGPRAKAEPRIAAWFAELAGDLQKIGCRYQFQSKRVNLNKASAGELATIPDVSLSEAEKVWEYIKNSRPFQTLADLDQVPELKSATKRAMRRWGLTGNDPDEQKYCERINVNTAAAEELMLLHGIGWAKAAAIIGHRPYSRLADLITKAGLNAETINKLRPWVTTGANSLSLDELGIVAIDVLHMSASLPRSIDMIETSSSLPPTEETEIEQRIAYWVRAEFGIGSDVRIDIGFSRPDGYTYGMGEVLELGRQVLNTLGVGQILRPGNLCLPTEVSQGIFTDDDVKELKDQVRIAKDDLDVLLQGLAKSIGDGSNNTITPANAITQLFEASLYGVSGAIPPGPAEPRQALEQRRKMILDEFRSRSEKCRGFLAREEEASASPNQKIDSLVSGMKALFGEGFHVLPTFAPPIYTSPGEPPVVRNFLQVLGQDSLLCGKDESRVRVWLQQAAVAHSPLRELEDCFIWAEAWLQPTDHPALRALTLKVAQLPFTENSKWLALNDAERGEQINDDVISGRGALSIVAAVAGSESVLDPENPSRLAGLLIEQWDELIPSNQVTTGLSFHYDGPSSQAPQCLLLAVPSQRGGNREHWHVDELAAIVEDTMNLAKIRAVDPDAMGEGKSNGTQKRGVGLMFPALMLPVDPERPQYDRATATAIKEWVRKQR